MSSEAASTSTSGLAAGGDILSKLNTAKELKEKGDKAFQEGRLKDGTKRT